LAIKYINKEMIGDKQLKRKKLLFFITTLNGGGAERILVDLINNLNTDKFEITVQLLRYEGVYIDHLNQNIKLKAINKLRNNILKRILNYLLHYIIPPAMIYRIFIKDDYDFEIAFLEGISTKILSYSTNTKAIKYAWIHTDLLKHYTFDKQFPKFSKHIDCYKRFDKIFCVAETVKSAFIEKFGISKNIELLYNFIDYTAVKNKAKFPLTDINVSGRFKICSIGRLVPIKGYLRLLEAFNRLILEKIDCELWLIGDGPEREAILQYIKENNLSNNVLMLGFKENPYKYMKQSNLFVCSSFAEGYSTSVCEALILGLPVVTTKCSGMIEILGNSEYGLIVENNLEGLYVGLKKVITNINIYELYKERAALRGQVLFNKKKRIENIERLFE
jgi:glycosyltransferase involved in cell wall biosynthesis